MGISEEIRQFVEPRLEASGIELVDVQYLKEGPGWTLRFFIDKEGGISLKDCEEWSHRLGEIVEESKLIKQSYSLEVSSPGLNRPLKKAADFQRFLGLEAVVKLFAPISSGQKNFHGKLISVENNELSIADRSSGINRIQLSLISQARLDSPS